MELRGCSHVHFIQAIKGGLVTKVLNVTRGRPSLSFKDVTDIYDSFKSCNDNVKAERLCVGVAEERIFKAEAKADADDDADASVCSANDHISCELDDNSFENITLKQIQEKCKTRKRKLSQGIDCSERKIKIEDLSSMEDCGEKQMAADDSDFMETLSSWRSKLSKNMKTKNKKCRKDPPATFTQETIPVVKIEETQIDQQFADSCGDSFALIEVKPEVPESDCLDCLKKLSNISDNSSVYQGSDLYWGVAAAEEAEVTYECILENEKKYVWEEHADLIPLQMVRVSGTDIVVSYPQLTSDQPPNFPAIEFEGEERNIQPDVHCICPQVISLIEDHDSDIYDNQLDCDTPVSLPTATNECLDCVDLGYKDDNTFLSDCGEKELTSRAEVQTKSRPAIECSFSQGGYVVCSSRNSTEPEEKQMISSMCDGEERCNTEAPDELISSKEPSSSKMHHPTRLLSNRKSISPSTQERLCKAMQSIDIQDKDLLKCRGKLYFGEQSDEMNGATKELSEITKARFVDNLNKISVRSKTFKRGFHPKGTLKIPHPSRPAPYLSTGCSSVQSCSNSAIAFSKQQMHDVECLAMRLTKELKSMKDIVDDMLRSEFCLNTSLRYKVNEARIAVKNATKAEENAKRCLSIMARNCSRFCKLMKLADDGPAAQDVVPKERKKIAFADEAGGKLCQVRFYEGDGAPSSESK